MLPEPFVSQVVGHESKYDAIEHEKAGCDTAERNRAEHDRVKRSRTERDRAERHQVERNRSDIRIAVSYRSLWEKYTGDPNGYPQVGTFVNEKWLFSDPIQANALIRRLNQTVQSAIETIETSDQSASEKGGEKMGWSPDILNSAIRRMTFHFLKDRELKQAIQTYYLTLGKPLDASFDSFFYTDNP